MKIPDSVLVCCAVCFLVLATGCTQSTPAPSATPVPTTPAVTPAVSPDTVKTTTSSLGTVLTDAKGKTLYFFEADVPGSGASVCNGGCAKFWPVFYTGTVTVSPPLAATDFTTIMRTDGTQQTAYKGWPLYYFSKDAAAGDMKGENVLGNWSVAKPDYTVMFSQQPGLGTFLTDGAGRTLYFFNHDGPGSTACTGTCLSIWPAFSSGPLVAPSLLKSSDFSGGTRPDGVAQSLYMGHPLYYYSKDTKPGDTNGQGFISAWYVANITGFVPPAPVPTTVPPTTLPTPTINYGGDSGGGGGGY